jgi:hypothetical protein
LTKTQKLTKILRIDIIYQFLNGEGIREVCLMVEYTILKVIEMKSEKRITLPKMVQDALHLKDGDHIAFLKDPPGIRIVKVVLDLKEGK